MGETSVDRLRRLLPEAKRLLSRQHIGAPWHALLAAEDLLREIDEARARFLVEVDRMCGMVAPPAGPKPEGGCGWDHGETDFSLMADQKPGGGA